MLISVTQVLAAQTHNKAQAELLLNGDKGVEVQLEVMLLRACLEDGMN